MLRSRRRLFICHAFCELLGRISDGVVRQRVNFFKECARGMAHRLMSLLAARKICYFVRCGSRKNGRIWRRRFRALEKRFWYLAEHGTLLLNFVEKISPSSARDSWCSGKQTVLAGFGKAEKVISLLYLYNRIASFSIQADLVLYCLEGIL